MQRFFPSWVNSSLGIRLGLSLAVSRSFFDGFRWVAGSLAEQHIERDMGHNLALMANQLAGALDRSLFERYREIQIIAEFKMVRGVYAD
jgi:hypothetical protein